MCGRTGGFLQCRLNVCVCGEQNCYAVHWRSAWIYCKYSRYWIKWQFCAFVGWNCGNWTIMIGMDHIKFPEMETVCLLWSTNWLWILFRQTSIFLRINSVFVIVLLWFEGNPFVLFLAILWSDINLFTYVLRIACNMYMWSEICAPSRDSECNQRH